MLDVGGDSKTLPLPSSLCEVLLNELSSQFWSARLLASVFEFLSRGGHARLLHSEVFFESLPLHWGVNDDDAIEHRNKNMKGSNIFLRMRRRAMGEGVNG